VLVPLPTLVLPPPFSRDDPPVPLFEALPPAIPDAAFPPQAANAVAEARNEARIKARAVCMPARHSIVHAAWLPVDFPRNSRAWVSQSGPRATFPPDLGPTSLTSPERGASR
jgi:hypothetical protein